MEISSTRISDLPVKPAYNPPPTQNNMSPSFAQEHGLEINPLMQNVQIPQSQGYMQINAHPNPYGGQPPLVNPVPPPHPTSRNFESVTPSIQKSPEYSIPSRDIPMDTTQYTQDRMIRPEHIPDEKIYDYLEEYEPPLENEPNEKVNGLGDLVANLQIPIIVAILFFIFQSNTINVLLNKYAGGMMLFGEDGNINMYGIALKSVMFGFVFFGINYLVSNM